MVLAVGKKAPKFLLPDKNGEKHSLESSETDRVVLYFYPKDDTPGCTLEAQEFSGVASSFKKLGVTVIGISGGDNRSKAKFCLKHDLKIPLLSDSDFAVSEAYGVYGEKKFMGRTYKGIHRTTFIVNVKRGVIEEVFSSVKPEGHAQDILLALKPSKSRLPSKKISELKKKGK